MACLGIDVGFRGQVVGECPLGLVAEVSVLEVDESCRTLEIGGNYAPIGLVVGVRWDPCFG